MSDAAVITTIGSDFGANYRVRLEYDSDAEDPRTGYEPVTTFVLNVRQYSLPREGTLVARIEEAMDRGGFRLAARYLQAVHAVPVVLPVWGYEHGDLSLSAGERNGVYADRWDSGLAGLAYSTPQQVRDGWGGDCSDVTTDALEAALQADVAEYDAWLGGDVYGYVVERSTTGRPEDWEEVDSCWGFIGYSWAVQAATEAVTGAVEHGRVEHAEREAAEAADQAEIESLRLLESGGLCTSGPPPTGGDR